MSNSPQKYGVPLLKEILTLSPPLLHTIPLESVLPGENDCTTAKHSDILSFVSS